MINVSIKEDGIAQSKGAIGGWGGGPLRLPVLLSRTGLRDQQDAKTKPSAAIVYLCCADEAEIADLHKSIRLLYLHVNYQSGYPVFIFHDILTPQQEESLRSAGRRAQLGGAPSGFPVRFSA